MRSFFDWFRAEAARDPRDWLLLGKGPSFSRRTEFDLGAFRLVGLNHVVREQPVDVAHLIDLEVVEACGEALERNARVVVVPWRPHESCRPGARDLGELARTHPRLRRLEEQGRLLWYNAATATRPRGDAPVVPVTFFSAEAALNLLAMAGATRVRSLGIDGGRSYGCEFADLRERTLLANGQSTFDRQFEKFAETLTRTELDFAPLGVEAPIRVYVGATPEQHLPTRVLEYSIRRRTPMTVCVVPLHETGLRIPEPRDPRHRPRTPFSFQRFLIPAAAGHRGRAIYLDSDMQVFRDLRELWTLPFQGAPVLGVASPETRRAQFAVMLLDCAALGWEIEEIVRALDEGVYDYDALMNEMAAAPRVRAGIDACWNHLDRYEPGRTALLHYTDMPRQPWLSVEHPWGKLWVAELARALEEGFLAETEVDDAVARGAVRPSLRFQLERGLLDARELPGELRERDRGFVPPHVLAARGRAA